MKYLITLSLLAVIFNNVHSMPLLQNGNSIAPYTPCKPVTGVPAINTFPNVPGTFGNMNNIAPYTTGAIVANEAFNMNYIPNNFATNAFLANEALSTNMLASANTVLANEMIGNAVITSANFVPLANMPSGFPLTPMISEIVPSLQYGDITMAGELPVGGTIKVCGCFPVYGMISVDGSVPSAGTAVVADMFGNQLLDIMPKCGNHIIM